MQMKIIKKEVEKVMDKNELMNLLSEENEYVMNLFQLFDVPEIIEDKREASLFLTNVKKIKKLPLHFKKAQVKLTNEEIEEEKKTITNKLRSRKSQGKVKKKKDKFKKQLTKVVTAAKSTKNERIKEEKLLNEDIKKPIVSEFNKESKLVFSKLDFPSVGSKFSKPKKNKKKNVLDKIEKNPIKLIAKLKKQKADIQELVAAGEEIKASEMKQQIAWKKVFDKTAGKKIKDNPTLIMKGLVKRRKEKKKSKVDWKEREQKLAKDKEFKQKKRQTNINKKIDDKKKYRAKLKQKIKGKVV